MPLTIRLQEKTTGVFTLFLAGSIDTNTHKMLEDKVDLVLRSAARVIVFDMKDVEYISSAGVRVVLKARKVIKKQDGQAVLVNLQPQVKKVFEIIKAMPTTQIFSSVAELDEYLDCIQKSMTIS